MIETQETGNAAQTPSVDPIMPVPQITGPENATPQATVREAVGVFHDPGQLQAAIDELQTHGFMRHEISVLAGEDTIKKKLGHLYRRVEQAEDDPEAPRAIFTSTEEVGLAKTIAIGIPLFVAAVTAGGAIIAAGGLILDALIYAATAGVVGASIGSILATFIAKHRAEYLEKQIEHGGILLWVHLRSPDMEQPAQEILRKYSADDVHIHDVPVYKKENAS